MGSNSNYSEYADKVKNRLWKTKQSRFNASRRLNNKYRYSVASISILSIFGIGVPIIQNYIDSNQCSDINKLYTLVSILLSIFILVLSLLEGSQNYQVKADKLYSNAVNISSILKEINFLIEYELEKLPEDKKGKIIAKIRQYEKEYDNLIKQCSENHDPDDYLLFQAENYDNLVDESNQNIYRPNKKFFWSKRILIWLRIKYYWLYFISITIASMIIIYLYISCPI